MLSSVNKRLVAADKFLVAATKNLFVVPYFVAVTKPFFSLNVGKPVIHWQYYRIVSSVFKSLK